MSIDTSTRAVAFASQSPDAVARVSPPGMDNQDGGSGRRGRLRSDRGVSLCLCAGSPLGYAPLAAIRRMDRQPCAGCAIVPFYLHRWIWRQRRLEQLARLLTAKLPRLGDQLLGIIELVHSEGEQARSRALCEAAVRCVARDAQKCDLDVAAPSSRHRAWGRSPWSLAAAAVGLGVAFPAAAVNAWERFLAPWGGTPRYTFAAVEPLPAEIVVPHGEPFQVAIASGSRLALASSAGLGPTRLAAAGVVAAWKTAVTASNCRGRLSKAGCT